MWCARCQADVAAEVSSDAQHVRCAHCGAEIVSLLASRTESRTRQARELLKRWAQRDQQETTSQATAAVSHTDIPHPADTPSSSHSREAPVSETQPQQAFASGHSPDSGDASPRNAGEETTDGPFVPFDHTAARYANSSSSHAQSADSNSSLWRHLDGPAEENPPGGRKEPIGDHQPAGRNQPAERTVRIDGPHMSAPSVAPPTTQRELRADAAHPRIPAPHVSTSAKNSARDAEHKAHNWVSTAGQWLAYIGVLGLMAGTCLVLLGYFRGPASYAPTGWLITMAGQMLLFLGVVTLVSAGMEQTAETVARHIDKLDDKLQSIERAAQSVPPPHALQQFREDEKDADAVGNPSGGREPAMHSVARASVPHRMNAT